MEIEIVRDRRGLDAFIGLPWRVYEGNPHWVPPLIKEMRYILSPENPFFRHAEAEYFLLWHGKDVVGRIAAISDAKHVEFQGENVGYFGFFECLPDAQAAPLLYGAASEWLRRRGLSAVRGPMNPSTNDECGFLLEGYDADPMIMMPYTQPYYHAYAELCGMRKAKDLFAYSISVAEVTSEGKLEQLGSRIRRRIPGLSIRHLDIRRFESEIDVIKDIYNSAWSRNCGFVPMTDEEISDMARRLKPLIVPELVIIAEVDRDPAGFFMVVPDYNAVLKRLNGRLGPVGIAKFLWYSRRIPDIRGITLGVKDAYRRRGIEGALYLEAFRAARRRGYRRAEMSWILEDNVLVQRGCEFMGGKLYKKYRIYEKEI